MFRIPFILRLTRQKEENQMRNNEVNKEEKTRCHKGNVFPASLINYELLTEEN